MLFSFSKIKNIVTFTRLHFSYSRVEILDKLDRYSHLSIDKNLLSFIYLLGFVDFIDAKFREAYLAFAFISKIVSLPWNLKRRYPINLILNCLVYKES